MHYKSQVSINYYSTLSSECIQESLPDQLTIDRSSFRVPWWLLWLITTLPSSVAAWQSSFDIFPNCCGCSSHHEVLSLTSPSSDHQMMISHSTISDWHTQQHQTTFCSEIIVHQGHHLTREQDFEEWEILVHNVGGNNKWLCWRNESSGFIYFPHHPEQKTEQPWAPRMSGAHLPPPLSRSHRNISFSWRVREGNLSTCQVQIKTVNLNFNLLDQFNLFKGSPPLWWILILITQIVAQQSSQVKYKY